MEANKAQKKWDKEEEATKEIHDKVVCHQVWGRGKGKGACGGAHWGLQSGLRIQVSRYPGVAGGGGGEYTNSFLFLLCIFWYF